MGLDLLLGKGKVGGMLPFLCGIKRLQFAVQGLYREVESCEASNVYECKMMTTIYSSGEYLAETKTWHVEDSPWKASQISRILEKNAIQPKTIAEIGCGAGAIIEVLADNMALVQTQFTGYDISPHAIELAKKRTSDRVKYVQKDLLAVEGSEYFDVLLIIDVFEHIPDYLSFIEKCRAKAEYKVFHIPLDIHVSSIFRNTLINFRYSIGHLHYFTADSALAALKDCGYEVVDYFYTCPAFGLFEQHPSIKKALANGPRWFLSNFSVPLAARLFGGYSLLVLAR